MSSPPGDALRSSPTVAVVIVNFRTAALVVRCLESLRDQVEGRGHRQVVVVDNDSADGSAERIEAAIRDNGWQPWARLERSPRNGGFGAGNNVALRGLLARPDAPEAVWLLNPDTEVEPGALDALLDHMDRHPDCGIVGSQLIDADGTPWPYAFRFPSWQGELESAMASRWVTRWMADRVVAMRMGDRPQSVDWVSGASMMVRRSVFEQIGLLDEGYFLYFEETDFARRAQNAGWASWYVPASRVVHISGQSTGVTGQQAAKRRRPAYWFESRRRYFVKHHGAAYAVAADATFVGARLAWHLRRRLRRTSNPDPPRLLWDMVRHSALFKGRGSDS
jgi:N-acetylglucosaminyl-diphospho-decaprenol L-rhamnosyltransferase